MNLLKISAFLVIVGITVLSLMPPRGGITIEVNDKIGHFIAYCVLMVNIGLFTPAKKYLYVLIFVVAYSALMEYCQGFVPGREVSWADVLANFTGACIGIVILLFLKRTLLKLLQRLRLITLKEVQ